MDVDAHEDAAVSRIASAIGEPARTRMLFCLMDGHARTSTELAIVAEVSPATASAHLNRLRAEKLVRVTVQGRYRYYALGGLYVARALESLSVLTGAVRREFVPSTPSALRAARSCYDHMAGTVAVLLHDRLLAMGWLSGIPAEAGGYSVTREGEKGLGGLGINVAAAQALRRKFAYACLDWSERKPHLGGALGAALLNLTLTRRWMARDLNSRGLSVTAMGRRELVNRFGIQV